MEYIVREYQLGEGSFGKVAKGFIRGPVPGTYTMKDRIHASVAMKFLKGIYDVIIHHTRIRLKFSYSVAPNAF